MKWSSMFHTTWFDLWVDDKRSILETMISNMAADLDAGYDYFGDSISKQRREIDEYKALFDAELKELRYLDEKQADRWCYVDLRRRGVI